MTRIKICGLTNVEDARLAVELGADALGFIFVPNTPRYIGDKIIGATFPLDFAPPYVSKVYVCQKITHEDHHKIFFDTIQFYENDLENDSPNGFQPDAHRFVQAFRVKEESTLEEIAAGLKRLRPDALLLDTFHKDKLGGSGAAFDWKLAVEAKRRFDLPIVLAGGLTPDNVADAIRTVQPYAVDVSSGVEAEPGHKDPDKLRAFIHAVRRADVMRVG